jgi:hypothetical protein
MVGDPVVVLLERLADVFREHAEQAEREADAIPQTASESNVRMHVRARQRRVTWKEAEGIVRETAAMRGMALVHGHVARLPSLTLYDVLGEDAPGHPNPDTHDD